MALSNVRDQATDGKAALTILIVDDDQTNRLVLQALLSKEGYRSIEADDGGSAVESFAEMQPDLVLMDVMMPGMDGYEATRQIKALAGERFVPVIFLTAMNDTEALARCVECGGDDFLTKPYHRVILKAKIDAMMRLRGLYAALMQQREELAQHRDRLQRDQEIAEHVFNNILQPGSLEVGNVRYLLLPVGVANGDLLMASRRPDGGYHYLLGDFTGHGLSAAVGAIPVAELFHGMTGNNRAIGEIARELNCKLKTVLPTGLFLAACLVAVEPDGGRVFVWNGGVPDALVMGGCGIRERFESDHLPLGILPPDSFDASVVEGRLSPGDRVYLYSDGVIETDDGAGELYGQDRLEACLGRDSEDAVNAVREELLAFRADAPQRDDVTLIEITCREEMTAEVPARQAGGWRLSLELDAAAVRDSDPLPLLLQFLIAQAGLAEHRERLFIILAELYNNAVDHGLLGLDGKEKDTVDGFVEYYSRRETALDALREGWIRVELECRPEGDGGQVVVRMTDSGAGFDVSTLPPALEENNSSRGRGIRVLHSLCERVSYGDSGSRAEAVYNW